jgi:ABC-type uncharacterized transport system involved in gliding motility auxiliary subunit
MNSRTSLSALIFLIVLAIIFVVNYIVGGIGLFNPRFDLTEKGIYTLSDGTKRILKGLNPEKPVTVRLYITQDNRLMPQWAQAYASTVRDLLLEFEKNSDGKVHLDKIDPRPNTEDEDKAVADDIQGYTVNENGDKAYFGVAIESLKQKEVLPSLNPNEEANLEYQLARAIAKVSNTKRQVVGVMSPMPVAAAAFNFPGMPQKQPPPWVVVQQLRQDYDVREVPMSSDKIDADVNVLLIIHPFGISGKTQFAIDQFLLKGGKVIAFVDPQCLVSKAYDNPGQPGMMPTTVTSPTSDLPGLFAAWGVKYDKGKVLADMTYRTQGARGKAVPTFITVDREGINREEPMTSSLEIVQMFGSGSFAFDKKDGLTYTPLVESSENSEMIDATLAEDVQRNGLKTFNPDGKKKALAVRLTGKFKTAYPDGAPKEEAPATPTMPGAGGPPGLPPGFKMPGATGESGGEDKKDAGAPVAAKDAKKDAAPAAPPSLKEGDGKGVVFLFADADMEYDMFALQSDGNGRVMPVAINSNIALLLNTVELLTGGSDLIGVRSRAVTKRPFTKMQELQASVEGKYRPLVEQKQQEMQKVVEEIAKKGGVTQDGKGSGIIRVNPAELKDLRDKQTAIQKDIRNFQKEQNSEKEAREMAITWLNILTVPLLLVAFGVALAVRRSSLRAAH